jgi:dynein heavy chain 1, cytosolic
MGVKMEIDYDRENIAFRPDFHLCITYNPSYVGRQTIPKNVIKHFRTVAMAKCDKKIICQLLLYSKGFKTADELSSKLNRVFDYC